MDAGCWAGLVRQMSRPAIATTVARGSPVRSVQGIGSADVNRVAVSAVEIGRPHHWAAITLAVHGRRPRREGFARREENAETPKPVSA